MCSRRCGAYATSGSQSSACIPCDRLLLTFKIVRCLFRADVDDTRTGSRSADDGLHGQPRPEGMVRADHLRRLRLEANVAQSRLLPMTSAR